MGVPYIWIDSLCIIQDSPGGVDWKREANRMGLVYAHAVCVVSATASADSEKGCFYDKRRLELSPTCVLRTQIGNENRRKSLVVRSEKSPDTSLPELFSSYVEKAPLTTRGWTFQERILAKHIVHYCDGFVPFECNTLRASQYHVEGVHYQIKHHLRADASVRSPEEYARLMERDDRVIVGTKSYGNYAVSGGGVMIPTGGSHTERVLIENLDYRNPEQKRLDFLRSAALEGMRGEFQLLLTAEVRTHHQRVEFHCAWYEIVDRYSIRVLTRENDRLIAIAGIATFIERSTRRRFIAGVWEETLMLNLLWNIKSTHQPRPLSSAPTWSWASVGTGVETKLRPLFAAGPYPILKYLVSNIPISETTLLHEDCILHAKLTLKKNFDIICRSSVQLIPDTSDTTLHKDDENLVYLPIVSISWEVSREFSSTHYQQIHGIVLRGSNALMVNEYKRTGYFWAEEDDFWADENETTLLGKSKILRPKQVGETFILV
jgi:hypothetical protein